MNDSQSLLVRGLAALEIDFWNEATEKLMRYISEIEAWNPAYGLVSASGDELVIKHILDSLAPWRLLQDLLEECDHKRSALAGGARAVLRDIGTGAGLPGIP